jgi:membrane protease YdiL (CAAX protease family)
VDDNPAQSKTPIVSGDALSAPMPAPHDSSPTAVAPVWHTLVLIAAVIAISANGAARMAVAHGPIHRIASYGFTSAMELALLAWVLIGLWLRKTSFRSIFGANSGDIRSVAADLGIAALFWIGSMIVLFTLAVVWFGIEVAVTHRQLIGPNGQPAVSAAQQHTLDTLLQLAPTNAQEFAAWALLCIVAGFVEEAVFRGYLQRQFIAWGRGSVVAGVVFSAIIFGSAHAYEGARSMFLIGVFGALLGILALYRRSLRVGVIAHAWHDLFIGIMVALIKLLHVKLS